MADAVTGALAAVVDDARAQIAAGEEPDADALRARIRETGADAEAVERALGRLERVLAVHRARARLAETRPAPRPVLPGRRPKPLLRTRATITGNMDVRRAGDEGAPALAWDAAPGVESWEVRFSERPDARSEYVVRETLTLPGSATGVPLSLGAQTQRIHVLGRGRGGKLVRRALIAGLTRENWRERWQRRASAA